jgi:hypothetical protein
MDVRGYPTGPIDAKGAFTSEIDLPPIIKPGPLNTVAEADRPHLVDQPGMRHKYLPLRHDPATGAISSGGRYLFRGYEDATKYRDFLEAKIFPGEQTTFWKRPFFFNTVRFAWCVTGAHDLTPITTHDPNATVCPMQNSKRVCQSCFPRFLKRRGGSISLTSR